MYYISLILYYSIGNKIPGKLGKKIRRKLVKYIFLYCGDNVNISENVYFGKGKNIKMYNHAGLGKGSKILGNGLVEIGEHCTMGPEVMIITGDHSIGDKNKTIKEQSKIIAPIYIGKDTYIGARTTILKGVRIEPNSVVGACSLINKNVEFKTLYAGVPAKKIKKL